MSRRLPRVYHAPAGGRMCGRSPAGGPLARIELWNGDICDLEVDAIVNAANLSLWMATGSVARSSAPAATPSSSQPCARRPWRSAKHRDDGRPLAARPSSMPCRSIATGGQRRGHRRGRPERAGPAREIGATSIAFPALGTGVGGFPLDEAARVTSEAVRDELPSSPVIEHVIFALAGGGVPRVRGRAARRPNARRPRSPDGAPSREPPVRAAEEQRDELVEHVAREIQLRGLTGPAMHFLEASRPTGRWARTRCSSSTRSCAACSAAIRRPRRSWPTIPASSADRPARGARRRVHLGRVSAGDRAPQPEEPRPHASNARHRSRPVPHRRPPAWYLDLGRPRGASRRSRRASRTAHAVSGKSRHVECPGRPVSLGRQVGARTAREGPGRHSHGSGRG